MPGLWKELAGEKLERGKGCRGEVGRGSKEDYGGARDEGAIVKSLRKCAGRVAHTLEMNPKTPAFLINKGKLCAIHVPAETHTPRS